MKSKSPSASASPTVLQAAIIGLCSLDPDQREPIFVTFSVGDEELEAEFFVSDCGEQVILRVIGITAVAPADQPAVDRFVSLYSGLATSIGAPWQLKNRLESVFALEEVIPTLSLTGPVGYDFFDTGVLARGRALRAVIESVRCVVAGTPPALAAEHAVSGGKHESCTCFRKRRKN